MSIYMPALRLAFENAKKSILGNAKQGVAAVLIRDSKCTGLYTLTDADDIPSSMGKANAAYVAQAFTGSAAGTPKKVVVLGCGTGENDTLTGTLELLAGVQVNYLAGPPDMTEDEVTAVKAWVQAYREAVPTLFAVLPNCAADDRGIINYTSTATAGGTTYAPGGYCARLAGILAGLPVTYSATSVTLEEVTAVASIATEDLTEKEARNAAIDAGQLIIYWDGTKAKIARGVNSYVSLSEDEDEQLRKIKPTEGEALVHYYTDLAIADGYQGKSNNSYDDKCVLIEVLRELLVDLQTQGIFTSNSEVGAEIDVAAQKEYLGTNGVNVTDMSDSEIKRADTGSWVFWRGYGQFADCMEDFLGTFVRGGSATDSE